MPDSGQCKETRHSSFRHFRPLHSSADMAASRGIDLAIPCTHLTLWPGLPKLGPYSGVAGPSALAPALLRQAKSPDSWLNI